MKLRTKFLLFIVVIHAAAIFLSYFIFEKNRWVFLVSEAFVLVSLYISWSLYRELIRPMQLLMQGVDAIRDRDFNVKFVPTGRYEMDKLIGVYNDMIDQLRQERTLQQEQHYFLEKLVQTAPSGIVMLDLDGRLFSINPKALELMGADAQTWIGRPAEQIEHPVFQCIAALPAGESKTLSMGGGRILKLQKAQFVDRGFPRIFVMLEELTAEILAAEKRSYGKVIRMMAHEVNNSVGAINSILDTTLQMEQTNPDITAAMQVAIGRNEHLNQFMRNFADVIRLPEPHRELFDLRGLLQSVVQLMEFKARESGMVLELRLPDAPFEVLADAGQLEQVLLNVVKNAIEAGRPGGFIRLETRLQPRALLVTNNGEPIPKTLEEKLFSPFFSTKNGGQGIGLTLTREILTAHGYGFSLKTGENGETVFRVEGL